MTYKFVPHLHDFNLPVKQNFQPLQLVNSTKNNRKIISTILASGFLPTPLIFDFFSKKTDINIQTDVQNKQNNVINLPLATNLVTQFLKCWASLETE